MRTTLDIANDVLLAAKEAAHLRALLDTNLLIAPHDEQHMHYEVAARWFIEQPRHGWASCPLTQNGCMRIMSQPNDPNPVPLGDALAVLQRSCAHASNATAMHLLAI